MYNMYKILHSIGRNATVPSFWTSAVDNCVIHILVIQNANGGKLRIEYKRISKGICHNQYNISFVDLPI